LIIKDYYEKLRDWLFGKFEEIFIFMEKDLGRDEKCYSIWKEMKNKRLIKGLEFLCDFLKEFCD
jgi:hypothetical protein